MFFEVMGIFLSKDLYNFLRCFKVLLRVRFNKVFLMDIFKFKLWEDIKNDMNGLFF